MKKYYNGLLMHAKVGKKKGGSRNVGQFGLWIRNDRGDDLVEFAKINNLKIASFFLNQKMKRKWTWISPNMKTKNEIDHILINDLSIIKNVVTLLHFGFPSDQRITRAKYKSEKNNIQES